MVAVLQGLLSLIGRVMLCAVFIANVVLNKVPNFESLAQDMALRGLPAPKIILGVVIVCLCVGSVSVILGYWTRLGALVLVVVLGLISYWLHAFWQLDDAAQRQAQMLEFLKYVAIGGGLVFIVANGGGAWSIDWCCRPKEGAAPAPQTRAEDAPLDLRQRR